MIHNETWTKETETHSENLNVDVMVLHGGTFVAIDHNLLADLLGQLGFVHTLTDGQRV